MAAITQTSYTFENIRDNVVRFTGNVEVTPSATEARLEIPNHVWVRVCERDGAADAHNLFANWSSADNIYDTNDEIGGWIYVGTAVGTTELSIDVEVDISDLTESGDEELYVVAASRPDIVATTHVSFRHVRNDVIGDRTGFPIAEA